MVNLEKIAMDLSRKGAIISVDMEKWHGSLPPKPEWDNCVITLLPDDFNKAFQEIWHKMSDHLEMHSILCPDGMFVPEKSWEACSKNYASCCDMFNMARKAIIDSCDDIRETAKAAAAAKFSEVWIKNHPSDSLPPPSAVAYASNLAASLIPRKEDFYDIYKVSRRINLHSFCFITDVPYYPIKQMLNDGELRSMAWNVINELVAGNARSFAKELSRAANPSCPKGRKIDYVIKCSRKMALTDLMPQFGLEEKANRLLEVVGGKSVADVKKEEFGAALASALELAERLSTVSGVLEALS